MRRRQWIELEDMTWCPRSVRDGGTDWLSFIATTTGLFTAAIPKIQAAMEARGTNVILDLCSGAGGPWRTLAPSLANALSKDGRVRIVLSDRYPNLQALSEVCNAAGSIVEVCTEPVDATHVPAELCGLRTMFNAFHHFSIEQARAVLADAVADGWPIAFFEPASARIGGLVIMPLQIPAIFLLTPFVRPFRWSRLLFTYLVPLIPLLVVFDGIVSFMRLYGQDELRDLVSTVPGHEQFNWEIGSLPTPGLAWSIGYLLGSPKT